MRYQFGRSTVMVDTRYVVTGAALASLLDALEMEKAGHKGPTDSERIRQ